MTVIHLTAPFTGWATSLDAVPDPVFAERMMGDGVAVDPLEGVLRAPCDADVIGIAATRHAVTLKLANGAELLIHIGLETVALAGEGFVAEIAEGARVNAGDVLIRFDLDRVAAGARSLVTPIVVANQGYRIEALAAGPVQAGAPLFDVVALAPVAEMAPDSDDSARSEIIVPLAHGLHARPAARIAAALKPFAAEMVFAAHGRTANARSPVALLTLGVKHRDALLVTARGSDARAALIAVAALIEGGMGEAPASDPAPVVVPDGEPRTDGRRFRGVPAAPGLGVGPIVQLRTVDVVVDEAGQGVALETAALARAIDALAAELARETTGPAAGIAAAHRALLDDPELHAAAHAAIADGKSAGFAWSRAIRAQADAIRATGDRLLIERIADLTDIERRLLGKLSGVAAPAAPALPAGAILIADELLPSQFIALDRSTLGGIATARGGPTAHVAILAAAAGVPMLVAAGTGLLDLPDGRIAILDVAAAELDTRPDDAALAAMRARQTAAASRHAAEAAVAHADCVMADGMRIEIFANLASAEEAVDAVARGAEGCGLLRTEFLFLDRTEAPSEEEQRAAYAAVAAALDGRPLIVRTLDIGGDKPVPYLPFPPEENPALGQRGIRLGLARRDLLAVQLRAILAGVPAAQCRIMLPMVVERAELGAVRQMLDEAAAAIGIDARIPLGVMVETPAAAMLASSIAAEADFLSIGSNDLTQYALAADRGNPAVAGMIDALHPAVLRLIAEAAEGAAQHGRWLGLCGGLASEVAAAPLLIGLGITELSAVPAAIPALKAAVRTLTLHRCRTLAATALAAASAAEVRALLEG